MKSIYSQFSTGVSMDQHFTSVIEEITLSQKEDAYWLVLKKFQEMFKWINWDELLPILMDGKYKYLSNSDAIGSPNCVRMAEYNFIANYMCSPLFASEPFQNGITRVISAMMEKGIAEDEAMNSVKAAFENAFISAIPVYYQFEKVNVKFIYPNPIEIPINDHKVMRIYIQDI